MAAYVFISYRSKEFDFADKVRLVLEDNGIACWIAPRDIPAGCDYDDAIDAAVKDCGILLVLISKASQQSKHVKREVALADQYDKPIIPLFLERCDLVKAFNYRISAAQRIDAYHDASAGFEKLVKDIDAQLDMTSPLRAIPNDIAHFFEATRPPSSRRGGIVAVLAVIAIAMICGISAYALLGSAGGSQAANADAAYVYASDIYGYQSAGSVSTYADLSSEVQNAVKADKAFSIVSFVRNEGDEAARVESVTTEITSLQAIEEPVLMVDADTNGNTLLVYAANDGWGKTDALHFDCCGLPGFDVYGKDVDSIITSQGIDLVEIGVADTSADAIVLAPGKVSRIFRCEVDIERFKAAAALAGSNDPVYALSIFASVRETGEVFWLGTLTYSEEKGLLITYQIGDGPAERYSVTLFGILDVENNPTSIRYLGAEASPRVEDTFRIETVIAPTRSCDLTCKNVFSVNGRLQETTEYDANVTVPVYKPQVMSFTGELTRDLAQDPERSDREIQAVADTYRYDPESIREQARLYEQGE